MKQKTERKRVSYRDRKNQGKLHVSLSDADNANFAYRWAADRAGRIAELQEAGYEKVEGRVEGGSVRHGGTHDNGNQMKKVLMRIPREFYDEDAAAKREERKALTDQIQTSPLNGEAAQEIAGTQASHARMTEASASLETG